MAACSELNDETFSEEVIACEEAVAHLETCCGSLDADVRCAYIPTVWTDGPSYDRSVITEATYPDIYPETSACYRRLSCEEIKEHRICESYRGTATATPACP